MAVKISLISLSKQNVCLAKLPQPFVLQHSCEYFYYDKNMRNRGVRRAQKYRWNSAYNIVEKCL